MLKKPNDNRGIAWVNFDGTTRFPLKDNEEITITAA